MKEEQRQNIKKNKFEKMNQTLLCLKVYTRQFGIYNKFTHMSLIMKTGKRGKIWKSNKIKFISESTLKLKLVEERVAESVCWTMRWMSINFSWLSKEIERMKDVDDVLFLLLCIEETFPGKPTTLMEIEWRKPFYGLESLKLSTSKVWLIQKNI